jgi:sporulation protein YlmC with PRC-barrel domain
MTLPSVTDFEREVLTSWRLAMEQTHGKRVLCGRVFFPTYSIHSFTTENSMLNRFAIAAAIAAFVTGTAFSQQPATTGASTATQMPTTGQALTTLPDNITTVANYYRQSVYDTSDTKIGEISDVLLDEEGKVGAFIIGVGGFLGVAEKDVAVPFDAVRATKRDGKWYLTMNTTKDMLRSARGYKFDKVKSTWEPV